MRIILIIIGAIGLSFSGDSIVAPILNVWTHNGVQLKLLDNCHLETTSSSKEVDTLSLGFLVTDGCGFYSSQKLQDSVTYFCFPKGCVAIVRTFQQDATRCDTWEVGVLITKKNVIHTLKPMRSSPCDSHMDKKSFEIYYNQLKGGL